MGKNTLYNLGLAACLILACATALPAQTLEQAKALFRQGKYAEAKPVFQRYARSYPNNGSYNYWYGACCYETGEKALCEKPLLTGARRKVQEAFRYLGQLYTEQYRFDEAAENYAQYAGILEKGKKPSEEWRRRQQQAEEAARMMRGVERTAVIDSFAVPKEGFMAAYKTSPESGSLIPPRNGNGAAYRTQLGNKLYASIPRQGQLDLCTRSPQGEGWGDPSPLPGNVNTPADENYPYALSDGITLYYASNGEGSIGGYDIFVTRYNPGTGTYLLPENIGMPYNSPFNDYMLAIDEYNNLGWFASDRFQPQDSVCVYVFIPNAAKHTYDPDAIPADTLRRRAMISAIADTWDELAGHAGEVEPAQRRLALALHTQPKQAPRHEFTFVIDDHTIYHRAEDFQSPEALALFRQWQQADNALKKACQELEKARNAYTRTPEAQRDGLAPALLEQERNVEQMEAQAKLLEKQARNTEYNRLSN